MYCVVVKYMVGSTAEEKIKCFKELVKSGYSVAKAQRECRLYPREYKRYYNLIWGDPEMEPYRRGEPEERDSGSSTSQPQASGAQDQKPSGTEPEESESERVPSLEEVITPEYKSQLEKELDELSLKIESLRRAVEKASRLFERLGAPPQTPPVLTGERSEGPRDVVGELEVALRDFEAKRARVRQVLESMGFKVEDVYMKRDEVERMVEEVKRRAAEEALDDKRIEMVGDIIRDAVARLVELFRPAVQAIFSTPATPEATRRATPEVKREGAEGGATG